MLYLYPSNKTESLAQALAKLQSTLPLLDPFDKEIVLTQSYGMGVWLKQRISECQGIACMLDTKMPAMFLWGLVESLLSDEEGQSTSVQHFEKATLRWEIFRLLPDLLEQDAFADLGAYIDSLVARSGHSDRELSLFQVSEVLADNFDAYQNYRSDWIEAWDEGLAILEAGSSDSPAEEVWQRKLWQALYPQLASSQRQHRAYKLRELERVLRSGAFDREQLPERLFIFGMAAIPVQWLSIFLALGKHIDIHFLFQNPCQYYWGDLLTERQALMHQQRISQSGAGALLTLSGLDDYESHPLLASLGERGRSYLGALYRYDEQDGLSEFSESFYEECSRDSALGHIQNGLLNGEIALADSSCIKLDEDESIRFARCHSRLREVEALRDYVLDVVEKHPDIELRDFIVMAPDIQQYAPFVDAVFGAPVESAGGSSQRLFYGLSDHALIEEQPVIEQLLAVLQFDKNRMTVDDVFDLLALEAVRLRFDLDVEQLAYARKVVEALNIRWGLNEKHRDSLVGAESTGENNTWTAGLGRALRSYMLGAPDSLDEGFIEFPLRGGEQQEILGTLLRVIDLIEQNAIMLRSTALVQEWAIKVQKIWHSWFDVNALDESLRQLLDKSVDALVEQVEVSGFAQQVPFTLVLEVLREELEKEKVSQRFLSGRINFCNLMPMRTVPFKVVCLLGMNEGAYPRNDLTQSFDLISRYPRRMGDRSRRQDDRYMFLEAILSAEERLYLSYKGFDLKDNSECFPSVLLSEFQDVCVRSFTDRSGKAAKKLLALWTYEHRLQPFHSAYYSEHSSDGAVLPQSFANEWYPLFAPKRVQTLEDEIFPGVKGSGASQADLVEQAVNDQSGAKSFPDSERNSSLLEWPEQLSLGEWERAFSSPLAYYYATQMGIHNARYIDVAEADEPFDLDGLQSYKLAIQMSDIWFRGASLEEFTRTHLVLGDLPQEPVARAVVQELSAKYADFCERIEPYMGAKPTRLSLDFASFIPGVERLSGEVYVGELGLVDVHFSKQPFKWFFGAWARHVVWNVFHFEYGLQVPATSTCLTPSWTIEFPALERAQAQAYLTELCDYLKVLAVEPRPLLPEIAFHCLSGKDKSPAAAFRRTPPKDDVAMLWQRYCQLSGAGQDSGAPPVLEDEPIFRQLAAHSNVYANEGTVSLITFEGGD